MIPDVSVVLEGTWPLRTGGVSRWLDALIRGLPDLTFAVTHLHAGDLCTPVFDLPPNVLEVEFVDIRGSGMLPDPALAHRIPDGHLIYALSSGEAGWLAAEASRLRGRPLALTEHGLAWREAAAGCGELESGRKLAPQDANSWVDTLVDAARSTYAAATQISTVSPENVRLQLQVGAPAARLRVIENWVDEAEPAVARDASSGMHVGMVCRVVPTKDLETFVESARIVVDHDPAARFTIIGPLGHDAAYAQRISALIVSLGLSEVVALVGEHDPEPWWSTMDIVALTSVSEAQPLVLLEAMAHALPIITTDVGGCRDLVSGPPAAGVVVPVRAPDACADAILTLARQPDLRRQLGSNGHQIARSRHSRSRLLDEYRRWLDSARRDLGPTRKAVAATT